MASGLPSLASTAARYRRVQAARAAKARGYSDDPVLGKLTGARAQLPPGGFAAVIRSRRIAGPPAPRRIGPPAPETTSAAPKPVPRQTNPKKVAPVTVNRSLSPTRYHTPTPAPPVKMPSAAPAPTPAPVPTQGFASNLLGAAGNAITGATGTVGTTVRNMADTVTAAPVGAAPPPAATAPPAPAAIAPTAPAAYDPYAGLPPEVAALLRSQDATSQAQSGALQGYYNAQAQAAQQFAGQLAGQMQGLAGLAGTQIGTPTALGSVGGATAALPGELAGLSGRVAGASGLNTTNLAGLVPGYLRQAGISAQQTLAGSAEKARGATLQSYLDDAAKTLQTQLEQQGLDSRQAAQIASSEKVAAQQQAVAATNNQLDFLSNMLNAQIRSGDNAAANQTRTQIAELAAQAGLSRAQVQANATLGAAGIRAQAGATTAAAKNKGTAAKDYAKLRTTTAPKVRDMLQGTRVSTGSTSAKNAQGQTVRQTNYAYSGGQAPDAVMAQLISTGLRPRDAYNMVVSAARGGIQGPDGQTHDLVNPWTDLYHALVSAGTPAQRAGAMVQAITGHKLTTQDFADAQGHTIQGP